MSQCQMTLNRDHNVKYTTLHWPDTTTHHQEQWASVVDQQGLNPSLHPKWVDAIASGKGVADEIRVLTGVRDKELEAVIPYLVARRRVLGIPLIYIELASNLASYHAEIVSRSGPHEILQRLLSSSSPWHVFHAANLRPDGPTASALRTIARSIGARLLDYPVDSSPYLPISGSWESFVASKNKKFRYKYRQRQKLFDSSTDYTMRWLVEPRDVGVLLTDILHIESRSWKARSGIDISSNFAERRYYEALLPFLAERQSLIVNIFYVGARPIAYNMCCNWNGWVGQLKTSFDEEYKSLSPGSIVIDAAIEEAFRVGAKEFDFLGDADNHKLSWTQCTREHSDFFMFAPARRSRLIGYLKTLKSRV